MPVMAPGPRATQPVSESKRERDIIRWYAPAYRHILRVDGEGDAPDACPLPPDYVPRPSRDAALNAFAQLAAVRLGAQRATISVIDDQREHVLAEATRSMSLRAPSPPGPTFGLWLGNVSIPRAWGMSEQILAKDAKSLAADEGVAVIINDLAQDGRFANRTYVKNNPHVRFYAACALLSPSGSTVGTLSIYDDAPRSHFPSEDLAYLHDLATTIVEYLETYTVQDAYQRGEQLTRGLMSFAEGAVDLQPFDSDGLMGPPSPMSFEFASEEIVHSKPTNRLLNSASASTTSLSSAPGSSTSADGVAQSETPPSVSVMHKSVTALQNSILPANTKQMFARAAAILRASSDLDGVLILDASVAAATPGREHEGRESDGVAGNRSDDSVHRGSSSGCQSPFEELVQSVTTDSLPDNTPGKRCGVLGYAARGGPGLSHVNGARLPISFMEEDLTRMLRHFPDGKVFNFSPHGAPIPSTSDSETQVHVHGVPTAGGHHSQSNRRIADGLSRATKTIQSSFEGVRSVAFIPFWDYERLRWFAGCLCWTNSPDRLLFAQLDMNYFKVFGNFMMSELGRLDALALKQAKETFAASVSHELRSPLHGILGTLQFIQETALDSFQVNMLNSMAACGHTLRDTIDSILDYAKHTEMRGMKTTKRLKGENSIRLSSKPTKSRVPIGLSPEGSPVDLARATEEVVEAVFTGQSFRSLSQDADESIAWTTRHNEIGTQRKKCFVIFDMTAQNDWQYCVPAGSWRRIVMNIVGNALKYTNSGSIHISIRTTGRVRPGRNSAPVVLTVKDSGIGMSKEFMANRLFQPFSQENPHSVGTGLGMSIVRQIIEIIGGKVEVTSDTNGTEFKVKLALSRPKDTNESVVPSSSLATRLPRLKGRRVCILHRKVSDFFTLPELANVIEPWTQFVNTLANTLSECLQMQVVKSTTWQGHDADIVICPDPSFEFLAATRKARTSASNAPMIIFVAMDGIEAATLRSDARIRSKESVVEIMTQPCGPYKLANILNHCLDRYGSPDENIRPGRDLSTQFGPLSEDMVTPTLSDLRMSSKDYFLDTQRSPESNSSPTPSSTSSVTLRSASAIAQPPNLSGQMSKVLIVDDNVINRRILAAFLNRHNMTYKEAGNGWEALTMYRQSEDKFEIILMDISMPVMDGMTATREIRKHEKHHNLPATTIIALTGLASASARLEAWSAGISQYITKPINFKELGLLIWGEGSVVTPGLAEEAKTSRDGFFGAQA